MGGRLDHETRQRIRRARSDDRRSRAYRAMRLDWELEREMTITSALICAGCQHPFRQHAFGGDCTLASCDCGGFVVAAAENGNGHQAVDVEPQQATKAVVWTRDEIVERIKRWAADHGEPPTRAQWEGPTTNDRPNMQLVAKRFGKWGDAIVAAGFPRPTKGTRKGASGGGTTAEPQRRPPAHIQPTTTREAEAPPSPSASAEPVPAAPPPRRSSRRGADHPDHDARRRAGPLAALPARRRLLARLRQRPERRRDRLGPARPAAGADRRGRPSVRSDR